MIISVKQVPTSTLVSNTDYGWADNDSWHLGFVCTHENAIIEPPCCNGTDCICGGIANVRCDCEEEGFVLAEKDIEIILEQRLAQN